ncbi:MAG TPA: SCP2 sterol-binding domain-containing protein [Terrimesophilobacter sp.]|nr:SCP2 sterol-binding domain-containing protein [Terrimesophilobacter sp.]
MADATSTFFESLGKAGPEPLLGNSSGSIQFELGKGKGVEHWHVAVKKGDLAVSNRKSDASATVRCDKALFDGIVAGEANAMAATLRGALLPEGDLALIMAFARLFPGPATSRSGVPTANSSRRTS